MLFLGGVSVVKIIVDKNLGQYLENPLVLKKFISFIRIAT